MTAIRLLFFRRPTGSRSITFRSARRWCLIAIGGLLFLCGSAGPSCAFHRTSVAGSLATHDRAVHIHGQWIRDPDVVLAPDGSYYLTGTTLHRWRTEQFRQPVRAGLKDSAKGRGAAMQPDTG